MIIQLLNYIPTLMEKQNKIIYNSDLIIRDRSEIATLCLFYEQVLLPYTYSDGEFVEFEKISNTRYKINARGLDLGYTDLLGIERHSYSELPIWENENKVLFDEKVIQRIPTASEFKVSFDDDFTEALEVFFELPNTLTDANEKVFVRNDVIEHLFRQDLSFPGIFIPHSNTTKREILKAAEASHTFKYLLPQISSLSLDEILLLRQKLKDTREGFSMHLQTLSKEVEAGINAGAQFDEISREALKIVETSLIPDYREFSKQLTFERTSFGGKVLDAAGKILEIDVAPWTPKFWGQTFKALGSIIGLFSEKEKAFRTNKEQAFRFMHFCERYSKK